MVTTISKVQKPDRCRKSLVISKADSLTDGYSTPPIPVLEIAETCGVDVIFDEMGSYKDQIAGFCDFKGRKLYVNACDSTNRQTFTIAHELGHWLLHREFFLENLDEYPVLPRFQTPDSSNVFEQEANSFAANLLVPSRLLLPVKDAPISLLTTIFSVSKQMMEIRLKNV